MTVRAAFRSVETGLHVPSRIKGMYPYRFAWLPGSWGGEQPHFDLLMGGDLVRRRIDHGDAVPDIVWEWENQLQAFDDTRAPYLMY